MEAAERIRHAVAQVSRLRDEAQALPGLQAGVGTVKRIQARRFAGTYADLLADPRYASATRFFLDELYSDKDYAERDAQFSRIAGALERLFPQHVVTTAVELANLHALTEQLDHDMAVRWQQSASSGEEEVIRYSEAWRGVGRREDRLAQLQVVVDIGRELERLTRMPGLRLALRMMRGPASAAGMGSLQTFLEAGFDTFAQMARQRNGVDVFLATIRSRELAVIELLFDSDLVACGTQLAQTLGQAR
jgi:hypothetical protein